MEDKNGGEELGENVEKTQKTQSISVEPMAEGKADDKSNVGLVAEGVAVESEKSTINFKEVLASFESADKGERHKLYEEENKGKRSTLFKVGAIYFAIVLSLIGVRIMSNLGWFDGMSEVLQTIVTSGLIQIVIMFAIPVIFFSLAKKQKVKQTFKDFEYKKVSGKVIACAVGLGFIVFFLNGYISSIFSYIIELLGYENVPSSSSGAGVEYDWLYFLVCVVCSCLLPALCEETAHRGMLLNGIKRYGVGKAILISGLLFGLIHLNINQFFYATIIGWFLGMLTIVSNSIYPAMIVHFMNNFLSTCGEFALANGLDFLNLSTVINSFTSLLGGLFGNVILFIFFAFVVWLGIYLVMKIYKEQKFSYIKNKIIKDNLHFFLSSDNMEINDKNINDSRFEKFFGTDKVCNASILYLMDKTKGEEFWNSFEDTYLESDKRGLIDYIFIVGAIVMGVITTIFTFIWGIL